MAERLRNLGKFTFADVAGLPLPTDPDPRLRRDRHAGGGRLHLIAQMVGAGQLIQLLFGL